MRSEYKDVSFLLFLLCLSPIAIYAMADGQITIWSMYMGLWASMLAAVALCLIAYAMLQVMVAIKE